MKKKIFGFDLGIASIGWAVVEFDNEMFNPETGEVSDGRIIKSGVRCFPVAENPKDGSSLAAPRREKRLSRRICRRKSRRLQGIKKLFIAKGLASNEEEFKNIYASQIGGDVWDLRIKGLSEKLSKEELIRVLTHLAKYRGFKSCRKAAEESDAEGGKVLAAIKANNQLITENKTLAQIIVERAGRCGKKHNYTDNIKGKNTPVYNNSIPRNEIMRETDLLYENQKQYGLFTQDLLADYKEIAFRQRPVGSVEKMVGFCTFEKGERRAPKEAPSSEIFVALGRINNLKINENNDKRFLNADERNRLLELLKNTQKVKFQTISKKLFAESDIKFADIDYNKTVKNSKDGSLKQINPEDVIFYEMKGWHKLKSLFSKEEWDDLSQNLPHLDTIMNIIACEKNDEIITEKLKDLGICENNIKKLVTLTTDKFINLSLKALYKINPYLQDGLKYNDACEKSGYDFKDTTDKFVDKKAILLAPISEEKLTAVPVVNRTVAQFRKVYNAMVREFGEPDQINIETGRDLKKNFDERRKIENKIKENEEERSIAVAELQNRNLRGSSTNILKYRLYQEQDGKSIYSGTPIDLNRLEEEGYLDIDHIIPYSRSLDNSYNNKVLCLSSENRMKGNKTPFEYIQDENNWHEFKARINSMAALKRRKKDNLLNENFADRELEFRERNANDNSYIARFVKKYLEDGIDFSHSPRQDINNRIQVGTGSLTDYLRHCWGLHKSRNENDKHHAQDAIVIACATQGMVKYLSTVSSFWENKWQIAKSQGKDEAWYKSLKHKFSEPWPGFRVDVLSSLENIFVSRPPRKSATGEIHQETIRSINPKHKNYDEKTLKSGIKIRGGLANNGSMLRTDVFVKKNKKGKDEFYLVPVYLSDLGHDLPNKAIVGSKPEDEWIELDESFKFKFSIYMDDLIKVTKGDKEIFGYFDGTDRSTASISLSLHDRSKQFRGIGVKTQDKVQKYQVDPLGKIIEIKKESRLPLTNVKSNSQRHQERKAKKMMGR